ncbi:MAG: hypothetical protein H8E79_05625 [Desulfobulbaceae bacterium]|uniref:Uncharacterized protein n=1 Tax=Candidatus Desulfatifera sulfidica TaxID=2841691 RepID=A0A8J6TAD9_9BACT|nr:hypothetical protein [Candidatus Desulfatifera sulfidica]
MLFLLVFVNISVAHELTGVVAVEQRVFTKEPLLDEQKEHNYSLAMQLEYYYQFQYQNRFSFIFVPFFRWDSADDERSHFDFREMNFLYGGESWDLRLGIGKVFWGATEFVHLVDIVNQTDLVESIDGEEKLGQPMVHLFLPGQWGGVDLFVLPSFRERTFPGSRGRLRSQLVVDTDHPVFESSEQGNHVDFALRYSHTIGDVDFGLSYFDGTDRQPLLLPGLDGQGLSVLTPYYRQIQQTGFDLQWILGEWLLKMESIYRHYDGEHDHYWAAVGGFEYTVGSLLDSGMDLGLIGEYVHDARGDEALTPFEDDIILGLRLAVNDAAGSEVLAGVIVDMDSPTRLVSLEASRRFGDRMRATVEAGFFLNPPKGDLFYSLREDDFLRVDVAFYF